MVANAATTKERIVALLDDMPDEAIATIVSFIEFQRIKLANEPKAPRFKPTPMGGLWKEVEITDEDIAEARREMWGRVADHEP